MSFTTTLTNMTTEPRSLALRCRTLGKCNPKDKTPRMTITNDRGVYVVKGETIFPLGHPDVQRYFRNSRWTLDPKRGEVLVDSVGPPKSL